MAGAGTDKLTEVKGHINSSQYQQILENNAQKSVIKLKFLPGLDTSTRQQPYTHYNFTKEFIQRNKYSVLEWPAQ